MKILKITLISLFVLSSFSHIYGMNKPSNEELAQKVNQIILDQNYLSGLCPKKFSDDLKINVLFTLIKENNIDLLKLLLTQDSELCNSKDFNNRTPLNWAISQKNLDNSIPYLLISKGSDINEPDFQGYTPLHWAIISDNENLIKYLLCLPKININIKTVNQHGKEAKSILETAILKASLIISSYAVNQLRFRIENLISNFDPQQHPLQRAISLGNPQNIHANFIAGTPVNMLQNALIKSEEAYNTARDSEKINYQNIGQDIISYLRVFSPIGCISKLGLANDNEYLLPKEILIFIAGLQFPQK